jgi:hypothetical protein
LLSEKQKRSLLKEVKKLASCCICDGKLELDEVYPGGCQWYCLSCGLIQCFEEELRAGTALCY